MHDPRYELIRIASELARLSNTDSVLRIADGAHSDKLKTFAIRIRNAADALNEQRSQEPESN